MKVKTCFDITLLKRLYHLVLMIFIFSVGLDTKAQSPGGVETTDLKLWNMANVGVIRSFAGNIIRWTDQANGQPIEPKRASTTSSSYPATISPSYLPEALNYNPTILFDGKSHFVGKESISNITHAFAVGKIVNTVDLASGALIGDTKTSTHKYFFHTENDHLRCAGNTMGTYTGFSTKSNNIGHSIFAEDLDRSPAKDDLIRVNGARQLNSYEGDPEVITNSIPTIGSKGNESLPKDSEIAEIILFSISLSDVDVSKIESYLAIKYGITLSNIGGGINGNYTSGRGVLIWDASDGDRYHNQVIGIGQDSSSKLLQKQSHSADDSTRVYISTLSTNNISNSGSFSTDGQFIVIGNDQGQLFHSPGNNEYPAEKNIYSRIDREWKITNSSFDGTFSIDLKLNASPIIAADIRVLIDDDGDLNDAKLFSPTVKYSDGVITVSDITTDMIPINSTRYLTIVSMNASTPLPLRSLEFTARKEADGNVGLHWKTTDEFNNDHFAVERSRSTIQWMQIGKVQGKDGVGIQQYYFRDTKPFQGFSFYRLRQTDRDGKQVYSPISPIQFEHLKKISIFPNPTNKYLTVKGAMLHVTDIKVYDASGKDISRSLLIKQVTSSEIGISLQNCPAGHYFIKAGSATVPFLKVL